MNLRNRIDFKVLFDVCNANPNGDPIENRPNHFTDYTGYMTQQSLKHKVRNAAAFNGAKVLLSNLPDASGMSAIRNKLNNQIAIASDEKEYVKAICNKYFDVRAFGALIPKRKTDNDGESINITGPVTISRACTVDQVEIVTEGITKSYNMKDEQGIEKSRYGIETYFVRYGLYVLNGSISVSLSEKTGFSEEDAEILKQALIHMFDEDVSNARPAGSINIRQIYWWEHPNKYGIYKYIDVYNSVIIEKKDDIYAPLKYTDYIIYNKELEGLPVQKY